MYYMYYMYYMYMYDVTSVDLEGTGCLLILKALESTFFLFFFIQMQMSLKYFKVVPVLFSFFFLTGICAYR
jgi:hypothetical protein